MPRKSSIATLPDSVRKRLDFLIAEGALSLDDLTAFLDGAGHARSRSAIHRHAQKLEQVSARMRQSREMVQALVPDLNDAKEQGEQGRLLVEMARVLVFEFLMKLQPDPNDPDAAPQIDAKDIANLGKGLAELSRALRLDQDFEVKLRTVVEKEEREKAAAAVEEVAAGLGEQGLSANTVAMIKAQILGIKPQEKGT